MSNIQQISSTYFSTCRELIWHNLSICRECDQMWRNFGQLLAKFWLSHLVTLREWFSVVFSVYLSRIDFRSMWNSNEYAYFESNHLLTLFWRNETFCFSKKIGMSRLISASNYGKNPNNLTSKYSWDFCSLWGGRVAALIQAPVIQKFLKSHETEVASRN